MNTTDFMEVLTPEAKIEHQIDLVYGGIDCHLVWTEIRDIKALFLFFEVFKQKTVINLNPDFRIQQLPEILEDITSMVKSRVLIKTECPTNAKH